MHEAHQGPQPGPRFVCLLPQARVGESLPGTVGACGSGRAKWGWSWVGEGMSFFQVYRKNRNWQVSCLCVDLSFQNGFLCSGTVPGLHSLLPRSHSSHTGIFVYAWMTNYRGRRWTRDVLFNHLADGTSATFLNVLNHVDLSVPSWHSSYYSFMN